jgi:hypothetical protein
VKVFRTSKLPLVVIFVVAGAAAAADQPPKTLTDSFLTPWAILTATAGLLAFQIGLYTLVGRERKSPYIINTVFPVFLLCLLIGALSILAALLSNSIELYFLEAGAVLLAGAFLFSAFRVFQITVRFIYFVDSVHPKHLPIIRDLRRRKAMRSPRPNYAHNTIPIPDNLKNKVTQILAERKGLFEVRNELEPQSLAVAVQHQGQGNQLLADLSYEFLKAEFSVQYLSASRHPIEFIGYLKRHVEELRTDWSSVARKIVAIDAYSPHFAFIDSIYPKKDRELESLDVTCVLSKMTFAGMHSAASRAFKVIEKQVGNAQRKPTLVIYEDAYALADLESPEQYRVFVRHVMPSERLWDGMFTVFVESAQSEGDWRILQSYASMVLDLRDSSAAEQK